jgi:2-polyprenyl-3-methyl-5-hydroxy-6-metoxy-1,4-benzoquinol methylase
MYGADYAVGPDPYDVDSPRDNIEVVEVLKAQPPGRLLDFGCRDGALLEVVGAETAWAMIGVEFDHTVVALTAQRTGVEVFTYPDFLRGDVGRFDAIHLGDVLEHLTDLDSQMPALLSSLRPGGLVLAEGPLQAGPSIFEVTVQATQALRSHKPVFQPPHHVIQATAHGQRRLFARHDLTELSWHLYEVDWPAPSRLRRSDLSHPRTMALRALRVISQATATVAGFGNRYRYVGASLAT